MSEPTGPIDTCGDCKFYNPSHSTCFGNPPDISMGSQRPTVFAGDQACRHFVDRTEPQVEADV